MEHVDSVLGTLIASPFVLAVVFVLCVVDGFFPPVPSETVVVAAVASAVAGDADPAWHVAAVLITATAGAWAGDLTAFAMGRRLGTRTRSPARSGRVERLVGWARSRMRERPATLVLVGRLIPVGRVAVNMTAGVTGMATRRFAPLALAAGAVWSCMCLGIATLAATLFGGSPTVAALAAIVLSVVLGVVVDRVVSARVGTERVRRAPLTDVTP